MKVLVTGTTGFIGSQVAKKVLDFIKSLEQAFGREATLEMLPMQPGGLTITQTIPTFQSTHDR